MLSIGLSLWPRTTGAGGPSLARPTAPAFTAAPGDGPGAIVLVLTDNPDDWGDAPAPEDDLGEPGILQWWNSVDGWQVLADPVPDGGDLPVEYELDLSESLWGETIQIRVRGVNDVGRAGAYAQQSVAVPGDDADPDAAMWVDAPALWNDEPAIWA